MKKTLTLFTLLSMLMTGCASMPFFATPTPTASSTPTLTPTSTATITPSPTITPTFTPSLTPTPIWVALGPGVIYVPIILYHHVDISPIKSDYFVPPEQFDQQMKFLHDWGYSTISPEMLVKAINEGAALPPHPILITFDDGDHSVYDYAFPIMQRYGFTGTAYLVYYYLNTPGFMTYDQVKQLAAYGWDLGSHSLTHTNLTLPDARVRAEVVDSKQRLEADLGVPVRTIAYPFGALDSGVVDYATYAGYIAGMGLGPTLEQGPGNLFNLQRRDIKGSYDLLRFASFLPWQGDPAFLPTLTPTP